MKSDETKQHFEAGDGASPFLIVMVGRLKAWAPLDWAGVDASGIVGRVLAAAFDAPTGTLPGFVGVVSPNFGFVGPIRREIARDLAESLLRRMSQELALLERLKTGP